MNRNILPTSPKNCQLPPVDEATTACGRKKIARFHKINQVLNDADNWKWQPNMQLPTLCEKI